jgi:hypothetical protein
MYHTCSAFIFFYQAPSPRIYDSNFPSTPRQTHEDHQEELDPQTQNMGNKSKSPLHQPTPYPCIHPPYHINLCTLPPSTTPPSSPRQ